MINPPKPPSGPKPTRAEFRTQFRGEEEEEPGGGAGERGALLAAPPPAPPSHARWS